MYLQTVNEALKKALKKAKQLTLLEKAAIAQIALLVVDILVK